MTLLLGLLGASVETHQNECVVTVKCAWQKPHQGEISRLRNWEHWLRVILELVGSGERVFITCGASHVIRDEPVLRAELAGYTVSGPL